MSSSISTILSQGLTAGQRFYEAISQNEVNATNPHYVRVIPHLSTTKISPTLCGVSVGSLERCSDPLTLRHLARARTTSGSVHVISTYNQELQSLIGPIGEESLNLCGRIQTLFERIQNPTQAPGTASYLQDVVLEAQNVAAEFNRLSKVVQDLRNQADQEVNTTVQRVNTLLQQYYDLNEAIGYAKADDSKAFAAQDERDAIFLELSSYLSVTESIEHLPSGVPSSINYLSGPNGISLVSRRHVSQLNFFKAGNIDAHTTVESGQLSGVQVTCDLFNTDITEMLTSGKMGGWLKLRDNILSNVQEALDELASTYQDQLNDIHNQGSAFQTPTQLLSSSALEQAMRWNGKAGILRAALTNHADGTVAACVDIDLNVVQTLTDLVTTLNTLPNVFCSWHGDQLSVQVLNNDTTGIALRGLSTDAQDLLKQLGLNSLFVGDPRRSPHAPTATGASAAIQVNPRILKDPRQLAHGFLSDKATLVAGETAVQMADWRNLVNLGSARETQWNFKAAGDLSSQHMRVFDYGRLLFTKLAEKAAAAQSTDRISETAITTWAQRLHEVQGVDSNQNRIDQLAWNEYLRTMMQMLANTYSLDQYFLSMMSNA